MKDKIFKKWILSAAFFNIIAAIPLAIPIIYSYYLKLLNSINESLYLGGHTLVAPTDFVNKLFVNTAGLALALVGFLLLYAHRDLKHRIGIPFMNAIARLLFVVLVLYYTMIYDMAGIIFLIAGIDVIISFAFFYFIIGEYKFLSHKTANSTN